MTRLPLILAPEKTSQGDVSRATGVGPFASDRRIVGSDLQDLIAIPSTRRPGIHGASSSRWNNTNPDVTYRINTPLPTCAAVTAMTVVALCVYGCHIVGYRAIIGGDIGRCSESEISIVQGVRTVANRDTREGEHKWCISIVRRELRLFNSNESVLF